MKTSKRSDLFTLLSALPSSLGYAKARSAGAVLQSFFEVEYATRI